MKILGVNIGKKAIKPTSESPKKIDDKKAIPQAVVIGEDESSVTIDFSYLDQSGFELTTQDILIIERDAMVKSFNDKMVADAMTIKQDFSWENVSEDVSVFVKNLNNTLDWTSLYKYVYSQKIWRHAIIQILVVDYEIINGTIYPAEFKMVGWKQENINNFYFNKDPNKGALGDLIYIPTGENFTKKYPYNFLVYKNDPDFNNVNGRSILKELKLPVFFKNTLYVLESRFFNKSILPAFLATYKTGLTGDDLEAKNKKVSSELAKIQNGAGIAMPNIEKLYVLNTNNTINIDRTIEFQDRVIAMRIFGTDLAMSQRNTGQASSKTGLQLLEQTVKGVASLFQRAKNDIIKLAIWNRYGFNEPAPVSIFDPTAKFDMEILRYQANFVGQMSKETMEQLLPMPKTETDTYIFPGYRQITVQREVIDVNGNVVMEDVKEVERIPNAQATEQISVEEQDAIDLEKDKIRKENESRGE